ncbi:hypothetical protein VTN77DRAFT_2795 [Rasamsonia byssochlamydoides]|uniref:uncharacterized protein n=1 Tax=Rasamsonia byssochlamydoides TaxID=89139 RepID=UPI003744A1D5
MVLLTSSTVSVIVTSSVICMSTFLLFLSGYALQQHSVRNIQHALRAPMPTPTRHLEQARIRRDTTYGTFYSDDKNDRAFGNDQHVEQEVLSEESTGASGSPGYYAYLQLLSRPDPSDICSAILFFKKLATGQSVVQDRLFLYPQEWDLVTSHDERVSTALSLLHAASRKYDIWLLPIDTSIVARQGYALTDSKLLRLGQIQFMQYDSVLYLRTPGLLLDAQKLDKMLLSRPLPLKYDRNRPESFNNEAWIPMPLRADRDPSLPPVYLITVNNVRERVEARTHIPNVALRGFGDLVAGPDTEARDDGPAYVVFEKDDDGHVRWEDNRWFTQWRREQYEVCEGLDLDGI